MTDTSSMTMTDGGGEPMCTTPTPLCADGPAAGARRAARRASGAARAGRCNVVDGKPACVPLGRSKLGDVCNANADNCAPGLICLLETCGNGLARCYQHCTKDASVRRYGLHDPHRGQRGRHDDRTSRATSRRARATPSTGRGARASVRLLPHEREPDAVRLSGAAGAGREQRSLHDLQRLRARASSASRASTDSRRRTATSCATSRAELSRERATADATVPQRCVPPGSKYGYCSL